MKVYGPLEAAQIESMGSDPVVTQTGRVGLRGEVVKYADGTSLREIVNTDSAQTLDGKAFTGVTKFVHKSDTKANLNTYAASATDGETVFATDEGNYYGVFGNVLIPLGGGDGSFHTIATIDADDTLITKFDVTALSNATFGNESTNHLSGAKSFLLTNKTGAVGEILETEDVTLALRNKQKEIGVTFDSTYDGADDDIKVYLYDVTNGAKISNDVFIKATTNSQPYSLSGYALSTTSVVSLRTEIVVANNDKKMVFDDITFSDSPFIYQDLMDEAIYMKASAASTSVTSTPTPVLIQGFDNDSIGGGDAANNRYLVKQSGWYTLTGNIYIQVWSGATYWGLQRAVNGTGTGEHLIRSKDYQEFISLGQSFYLNAGEYFSLLVFTNAGTATLYSGSDFELTRLPELKKHVVTPMNGPKTYSVANGDFTVAGDNSWTTTVATAMYYVDANNKPRLKGNMAGTISSATSGYVEISGVTFKNTANFYQAVSAGTYGGAGRVGSGQAVPNDDRIQWALTVSSGSVLISFDVELESKPTWADPVSSRYLAAVPTKVSLKYDTNNSDTLANSSYRTICFEDKVYDTHNAVSFTNFATADWRFTAPKTDYYDIAFRMMINDGGTFNPASELIIVQLITTTRTDEFRPTPALNMVNPTFNFKTTMQMNKGDTFYIRVYQNSGADRGIYSASSSTGIAINSVN